MRVDPSPNRGLCLATRRTGPRVIWRERAPGIWPTLSARAHEHHTMAAVRGNGGDVGQTDRDVTLSRGVEAPSLQGAVAAQGQAVIIPGRYGNHIGQTHRHALFRQTVFSPKRD